MNNDHIQNLYPTGRGFSQVVVATGQRQVFISGQCSVNEAGELVGKGDLGLQMEQVLRNIERALLAADAGFGDLVRLTIYVVDYSPEKREVMQLVRNRYIPSDAGPASTLIGVSRLVSEDFLVEVEAQAIVAA